MSPLASFRLLLAIAASLMALAVAPDGVAAPITVPTGLGPGSAYRLVFVTTAKLRATSTDIADYNSFVTDVANTVPELVALGTTWTAIGSTPTVDARDNTGTNPLSETGFAIYNLGDQLIAGSNADLWDAAIANGIRFREDGTEVVFPTDIAAWTGSLPDGTADLGNPALGDLALGSPVPGNSRTGDTRDTDQRWIQGSIAGNNLNDIGLYAISGTLVVPEPETLTLLGMGLIAFAVVRRGD